MGWGYSELGKEGGEALMLKSLEAYRRSGNRVRQASILSNLGVGMPLGRPLGRRDVLLRARSRRAASRSAMY